MLCKGIRVIIFCGFFPGTVLCLACGDKLEPRFYSDTGARCGATDCPVDASGDTGTDTDSYMPSAANPDGVFSQDKVHQIALTLPADDWKALQQNARDEKYTTADVTIDGESLSTVGLRFKGSYGNLYNCFNDEDEMICSKLSMKLKFNEYVDDQRFQGMKRLNLHGMQMDDTLLSEHLGYGLYRDMGIATSRTAYAEVTVNGDYMGLYSVVEQIDGRFTDSRFPDNGDGNLYKEGWPSATGTDYWDDHIKTNGETATHNSIIAFAEALNNATDDTLPQVLRNFVNVDYMFKYLAVSEAINNWDGIMMWYCFGDNSSCRNHNYYWYEEEDRPFFWLFPWDEDSTFVAKAWKGNPPKWNDLTADCSAPFYLPDSDLYALPPSCDPLIRGLALMGNAPFAKAVDELTQDYFREDLLLQRIDFAADLIESAVDRDPDHNVATWKAIVAQLKGNIPILINRLNLLKTGVEIPRVYLTGSDVNGFEAATTAGLQTHAMALANPGSSISMSINSVDPIAGNANLHLDVQFFDDGQTPYRQWSICEMYFTDIVDFSALKGIRFKVRSDSKRSVSVSLVSNLSSAKSAGANWTWYANATDAVTTVEMSVDQLDYPWWWDGEKDDLETILKSVTAIRVQLYPNSTPHSGFMIEPEDATLDLDDIEFVF